MDESGLLPVYSITDHFPPYSIEAESFVNHQALNKNTAELLQMNPLKCIVNADESSPL